MEEFNELQVIEGCERNDRQSQERLYKQFFPALFCMCRRFFQHDHEAMEALNDGMLKVYRHIDKYRPEKGSLFNWIYTIIRHSALDKLKLALPLTRGAEPLSVIEMGFEDQTLRLLEARDFYKLLDQLSPATRVVCSLYYIEGYSIKDITEQLAVSSGTVKWHLSESRKKLKESFEKLYKTNL